MKFIYETTQNSDLTEGRGHQSTVALFATEEAAVLAAHGRGVMGVGTGDVNKVPVFADHAEFVRLKTKTENIYGYRKNKVGIWGYGYIDNRDCPDDDPDYLEFIRLKDKLSKKYNKELIT